MGLEPNGDWKRMQSAMLIADVTGDWMEGVVVAQLVDDSDNGDYDAMTKRSQVQKQTQTRTGDWMEGVVVA